MSGEWEKYVEQATEELHRARFGAGVPLLEFGPELVEYERAEVRAVLAAVGPRIAEDARARLVAAAARAVEREPGWTPVELTITDEVDRKFVFNGDEADEVWVDRP